MPKAGNLLGTTRTVQPGVSRCGGGPPFGFGRYAWISGGVLASFPGQKGQNPPLIFIFSRTKSVGRLARSVEMITQRPTIGSFLSSGNALNPFHGTAQTSHSMLEMRSQTPRPAGGNYNGHSIRSRYRISTGTRVQLAGDILWPPGQFPVACADPPPIPQFSHRAMFES